MQKIILFLMMLMCPSFCLFAEAVSVDATVNTNQLTFGEAGQLMLTVHGVKNGIEPPQWPKIDGIETSYLGPSTSISIINGQYSSVHAYNYSIFPSKTGRVQIPAITLTIDGKIFTTQPIDIDIVDATKVQQNAAAATNNEAVSLRDKIFMEVSTPSVNVYLGQKVPIRIKLFINQLPIRNLQFPKLEQNGFTLENFAQPPQYNEVVNGVNHTVVDYQGFIYPTRTGEINIGPIQIQGSLLYKTKGSNRISSSGFFNDDLLSTMFDSYQERPISVNADVMKINVLPLPLEGRPNNFTGAVGQMSFSASISPQEVRVGDPVTLRMQLTGVANFKSLNMPTFIDERFKTYDPIIKDTENGRTLEQVIIPDSEAITNVPAIAFNYFDPIAKEYKVIAQGPFGLKVMPLSKNQEFKAVGFSDLSQGDAGQTLPQVDYIKKYVTTPLQSILHMASKWQFWAIFMALIALLICGFLFKNFREKLQSNVAFSRRLKASKNARLGIKTAKEFLDSNRPKEFYHALVKTLCDLIADKLHKTSPSLTFFEIKNILEAKGNAEISISQIKSIFEHSDLVQYASGQVSLAEMQEDLKSLNFIVSDLEKKL